MTKTESSIEARWFRKMNRASSGVYRLAHAVLLNDANTFEPSVVAEQIKRSAAKHLADHRKAVSQLTARSAPKKTVTK